MKTRVTLKSIEMCYNRSFDDEMNNEDDEEYEEEEER